MIKTNLMFIKNRISNKLRKRKFFKSILVLAGGTSLGQILLIVTSPLLTRLYSPSDYGIFQMYLSLISLLAVISTLRYEVAIPLPKKDQTAVNLMVLSMSITVGLMFFISLFIWLSSDRIERLFNIEGFSIFRWVLPISLLGIGIYQSLSYWFIRKQSFNEIAKTKVTKSVSQILVQIIFGLFSWTPIGLLIGDTVGRFSGSGRLAYRTWRTHAPLIKKVTFKDMISSARRYIKFPLISSWSALINGLGQQIAPIIIIAYYGTMVGGWFSLSQRLVGLPMMLVGTAISQVFYSEASKIKQDNPNKLKNLYLTSAKRLTLLGILPLILLYFFAPILFKTVFGNEWVISGLYVRLLAPMFFVQFVVVPLSQLLYVLEKQMLQFCWDLGRFGVITLGLILCHYFGFSVIKTIFIYGVLMAMSYIVHFFISYYVLRRV